MRDRFPEQFVVGAQSAAAKEAMRQNAPALNGTKPGRSSEKLTTTRSGSTIDGPDGPATLKKRQRDDGKKHPQSARR